MSKEIHKSLWHYFTLGVIPGPHETFEQFYKRCEACLNTLTSFLPPKSTFLSSQEIKKIQKDFEKNFFFPPLWAPLYYSSHKLPLWQGAVSWIESTEENLYAHVQINPYLKNVTLFRRLYPLEELISHEWIHIARMAFDCPKFEEMLAYQTSKVKHRRQWGALFSKSWESTALLSGLIPLTLCPPLALFLPDLPWSIIIGTFLLVIVGIGAALVSRLLVRQRIFKRCLRKLTASFNSRKKALNLMIMLTDREIEDLSISVNSLSYLKEKNDLSPRHQLIHQFCFESVE